MSRFLATLASLGPEEARLPWPRFRADGRGWLGLLAQLGGEDWTLVDLFADGADLHLVLRDEEEGALGSVRLPCPSRRFPSIGRVRPGAIRLERAVRDLHGIEAEEGPDLRPLLDHVPAYPFLAAEGEGVHQIPVGPVHATLGAPAHVRLHVNGELVVRVEARLGYAHKGIEALAIGRTLDEGARLAGRVAGDTTVAYAWAFARATEQLLGVVAPPRALHLRALMAELERIAGHLGDFGAICGEVSFRTIQAQTAVARERILEACESLFGHRLMMDLVVPGGVAIDLPPDGPARLLRLAGELQHLVTELHDVYESKPSLLDRMTGTGIVSRDLVRRFGAGGPIGRAAGRAVDVRRSPGHAPYDTLEFDVPALPAGDIQARTTLRIHEMHQSFRQIRQILEGLPDGPSRIDLPPARAGEGAALVESGRGDVLVHLRLDAGGRIARFRPRDPSWFHWPLLEAAMEGNVLADFPLCARSFNCSVAGHDL
jgi:Ni,Fe-hydrogenase III large subunit